MCVQATTLPNYKNGSSGNNVYAIQYLLNDRGYGLTVDGKFGSNTESAVKKFQKTNKLTIDGVVGPKTWKKLFVTVKNGSSGNAVKAAQYLLKKVYCYSIDVDGSFGPATQSAVKDFQTRKGLSSDGIVGPATWTALVLNDDDSNPSGSASDLISVAAREIGYQEGPDHATKYGTWYGLPNKPWCAMFVSWCANKAGIDTSVIPKHASCDKGVTWFKNKSKFKTRVSGYTPKAGDIIYFGSASDATHVGIVEKVSNKRVHTIEGNTSDCVARRDYSLTSTDIYGYGIPNYASK